MLPLGRVRTRILCKPAVPMFRTRATVSYSTRGSPSKSMRYIAVGGMAGTLGLSWLLMTPLNDAPCLESPPTKHLDIESGPSEDQVTDIISKEAYSFQVKNVTGVDRYDGTQVPSNSPCEDRFTHGKFPSPWNDGNQWMAWGVFDGHIGWQTADLLTRRLLPFVRHSLDQVKSLSNQESTPEDEVVQRAIMQGFTSLDDSIFQTAQDTADSKASLQDKVKKLLPAYSGSCALLSMYDPLTSTLHVACTGDSRAVLGQKNSDGQWEAIPLSVDQTGRNEDEIARLYKEHPGEEDIVKDGRVLGIMVSRAFGDSQWKWPLNVQQEMKQRFYGPTPLTPRYNVRTPPYLTATPVVTSTKIDPNKPSFLIMATDGMWDVLSNQQAVSLVGKWLEFQAAEKRDNNLDPRYEPSNFRKGVTGKFVDESTTIQDDNAAVHLVRNSLGGNHHELIAGRLAFSPPHSRRARDDITVQVAFFNTLGLESRYQSKTTTS